MPSRMLKAMDYRDKYRNILADLERLVRASYGERLVSLVLFGSVARDTHRPGSDIDFLLIAEPLPDGRTARLEQFVAGVERALGPALHLSDDPIFGEVHLSPIFKRPAEVLRGSLLFLDMTVEARILFDRDQFFGKYLDGLRARMNDLGSRRIPFAGGYYWDLKPDARPGERIVL